MSNIMLEKQINDILHGIGTASSRFTSSLNLLSDQEYVLDESKEVFKSLREIKVKLSQLVSEYEKNSDSYNKTSLEVDKIDKKSSSMDLVGCFNSLFHIEDIFNENLGTSKVNNKEHASIVANLWFEFSKYMPKFLAGSGSQFKDNKHRASSIQIAFEELGEGNVFHIHADSFKRTCEKTNIKISGIECKSLVILDDFLESLPSDKRKLGMGLGLEVIANENIQVLFDYLAFNEKSKKILEKSYFFKTHFINEDEHIRENVKNFSFCSSKEDKIDFLIGFKEGLSFWTSFWNEVSRSIMELS